MLIEFIYDSAEDYSPQRDNFLTPVYFEKEALITFIYSQNYSCEFMSETYGALIFEDDSIPFGINSQDHVIFWLGDLQRLPDKLKLILKPYNVISDKNIESDFKKGQLDAIFTESILEVKLFLLLNKINIEFQEKFGFKMFNFDLVQIDDLLKMCSAYKRITFNNKEDFKRIISDLHEKFIETINKDKFISYLDSKQIEFDSKLGGIKILGIFFKEILFDDSNIIAPFFYLYNLRIWADHSNTQNKFDEVVKLLGLQPDSPFNKIYGKLIQLLHNTLNCMLNEAK